MSKQAKAQTVLSKDVGLIEKTRETKTKTSDEWLNKLIPVYKPKRRNAIDNVRLKKKITKVPKTRIKKTFVKASKEVAKGDFLSDILADIDKSLKKSSEEKLPTKEYPVKKSTTIGKKNTFKRNVESFSYTKPSQNSSVGELKSQMHSAEIYTGKKFVRDLDRRYAVSRK